MQQAPPTSDRKEHFCHRRHHLSTQALPAPTCYAQHYDEGQLTTMKYNGHSPKGLRDFTKANYNLGSKDMTKALNNASLEEQGGIKSNTHKTRLPSLKLFGEFLKSETTVKRLNHI